MFEKFFNLFELVSLNFRLNDVVDILLFTCVIYYILKFMLAKPQRPLLYLVVMLAIVFALSKIFDLFLLVGFIRLFFTAFLVALAVILQKDIRRFFEQFSAKFSTGAKKNRLLALEVDSLVASISELAEKEIGAIFVFSSKESLDQIIHGGSIINAAINPDLIESIFDTRTPGHDGALIIERGKLVRFGCHLPLSKDIRQIQNLGTRHSAALGLAEKTDAFVVVVSEERGTISIAQHDRLFYNVSPVKLKVGLEKFYNLTERHEKKRVSLINLIKDNLSVKVGALFIALFAWILTAYEPGTSFKSVMLPIEMRNLNPELTVYKLSQDEVKVTLSGPSKIMNTLQLGNKKVALDFTGVRQGQTSFPSTKFQLELPRKIIVHRFRPDQIKADIVKFSTVSIPIKPVIKGKIPEGIDLIKVNVDPAQKNVLVPIDMYSKDIRLNTQVVRLDQISKEKTRFKTTIVLPEKMRLPRDESAEVFVDFVINIPAVDRTDENEK